MGKEKEKQRYYRNFKHQTWAFSVIAHFLWLQNSRYCGGNGVDEFFSIITKIYCLRKVFFFLNLLFLDLEKVPKFNFLKKLSLFRGPLLSTLVLKERKKNGTMWKF